MVSSITTLLLCFCLTSHMITVTSTDSLAMSQSIRDGETLISAGRNFELGFFSPGTSTSRYLGVWYRASSGNATIVWVANRENPFHNKLGALRLNNKGILELLSNTNKTIWSSNIIASKTKAMSSSIVQLLDTGNLVVKNGQDTNNEDNPLWQSFDYPGDTLMPGMKVGLNFVTGKNASQSCWKSDEDPAVGEYSLKFDPRGYPQLMQMKRSAISIRRGSWNGRYFTGSPAEDMHEFKTDFVFNKEEVYYEFEILDRSIFSVFKMDPSGNTQIMVWEIQTRTPVEVSMINGPNACKSYAFCGQNSWCFMDGNFAVCQCMKGYTPKFPEQWNTSQWSGGCVRKTPLKCNDTNGFFRYEYMKMPDTSSSWFSETMNLEECGNSCLKNCSCVAYASLDIRNGGTGCLLWFDYLVDVMQFFKAGQDLYIKVPASELDIDHGHKKKIKVGIAAGVIVFGLITVVSIMIITKPGATRILRRRWQRRENIDLPTFDFSILAKATENFSSCNKLGEGGFGPVYKGTLSDGQHLAVKRLSKKSTQGLEEFKNEVVLIAKLQHRNLVKLLDEIRRKLLNWNKRFDIISGIARGLLYLHQDSRLRIIHRDLKTSNILLDANMNPKISDFGLARTFLGDQAEDKTDRVVGTYGYMPPEYVVHGQYSMKSDVFSYGAIVLELISGKKNRQFSDPEHNLNLLGHAWRLWSNERPLELLDEVLKEGCTRSEVIRCIQVGLLCVQQRPADRPDMSSVVLMLNGEKLLPKPKCLLKLIFRGHRLEVLQMIENLRMLFISLLLMSCMRTITSRDSLEVGQSIQDGETLVSAGGSFELGFFSPGIPTNRYLGVWYRDASGNSTVVWVANREIPIQSNSSGVLRLSKKGILQLLNGTNSTIWSSNTSGNTLGSLIAQLLDSGNLVVKNGQSTEEKNFLWQSFDYPCDTLMPGMKLGLNLVTGFDISMSSWKSAEDPAVGEYSIKFDPRGYPQVMQWKGSVKYFRIGTFNGLYFTGYPTQEDEYRQDFVLDKTEVYYKFEILDRSIFYLYKLQPSGTSIGTIWRSQTRTELELATIDGYNGCGSYAFCGSNAICKVDANLASCECLKGYVPKFPQQWNMSNWSDGCVRKTSLDCNDTNSFLWYTDIKVPDTSSSWYNKTMDLKECEKICLKNCSCVAYANLDIRNGGSGCLLWFDNLIDMIQFSRAGQDIYIKVPTSELGNDHGNMKKKKVGIAIGATIFGLITSVTIVIMKKSGVAKMIQRNRQRQKVTELPTFDFSVLVKATENFSSSNKLGEGGFGSVYKGTLTNGQELAVKRLSKKSKQGLEEFKNEVALIAKLQHRNLVKLLGCCIQGVEKILIYEYMPNKSLDYFVFDEIRKKMLDWLKRFNIICGIARGLLYLHQDSRLRIIHRDLKTSNILLDANLNPKISDFGLARTFLGDQLEANTNRVAGTYGYMPPEYAVHGQYSMKSDVFSYGVILLELISGKKNREFSDPENYLNLLGHAWRLWTDEKPLELLDEVTITSRDSLEVGQSIQDGETLVSAGGSFELGFFSPGIPTNRYLGVWYRDASGNSTVVWVANREIPIQSNSSGVLRLSKKGILQLLNGTNSTIWSSNTSGNTLGSSIAQLLDSGNLVVKNGQSTSEKNFLWQSFDYPCDTLMPGMKLGLNLVTGFDISMSSWKSAEDPAVGEYSIKFDPRGYPQVMQWKGSVKYFRIGTFNGLYFTGYPTQEDEYRQDFVLDKTEVYYKFEILDRSIFYLYKLQPSGTSIGTIWRSQTRTELELATIDGYNGCGSYAFCGSNAICKVDANLASCECLKGYVPKFPQQWNMSNWSDGCVRKTSLDCNNTNSFLRYTDIKVPDTSSSWYNKTMNLKECENICLKNCSCVAYANLDIRNGGSGCLLWFNHLIDMVQYSRAGQDIYIKVPTSELGNDHGNLKKKKVRIAVGVIIFGLITCVSIVIIKKSGVARIIQRNRQRQVTELPTFDFSVLVKATENFSSSNKLGEGGFGSVYKGTLTNGQELAVKRLSKKSKQGLEEFKNEVALIAKLQHRNLVKLLGCCIQGVEKILIYEYMPNKSLDYFVFDEIRKKMLDWLKRFNIISGIARGLLYLHQDSRLRIIHRDLKTSNILLDANLNPKISDFGLARTFLGDQLEANTNRVAGTYGYMPPEYAVHGQYSMKSDVFSYGVILLELISGKKNREFSDPENYLNLLGHAWRLWTDEKPLELLDEVLKEGCTPLEVKRCIQVGLLCVQQRPEDRPDMSSVVLMLNGEKLLPKPKVPGFYTERGVTIEADSLMQNHTLFSANEISITTLYAR
ncbi:hypothetical protein Ahy_A09g046211 [Arachis hypogaea]|uniref:non-specific serine/threonine protein kinase n=1 Tax=Arachis hypogaea TaxID=3818 RepID=A0A445BP47_ARAHY|nr:hypothetical protein Ahy_A09g046211 [Arachis hypogaea]